MLLLAAAPTWRVVEVEVVLVSSSSLLLRLASGRAASSTTSSPLSEAEEPSWTPGVTMEKIRSPSTDLVESIL